MAYQPVKGVVRTVKPLISTNETDCKRRVLNLYKAWYRQLPETVVWFSLPLTIPEARAKLRSEFIKNKHVTDLRVIDMLVIKGQLELKETVNGWKQTNHVMALVKDTVPPRPSTFLSKFLAGAD